MPIANLGRTNTGNVYVDRSVIVPSWRPLPTYTSAEGGPAQTYAVRGYLDGDVTAVATRGSFNSSVFTVSGTV